MSEAIPVHDPNLQVTLFKTVKRSTLGAVPLSQRFQDTNPKIDLSPYIGEGSSVTVSKSVRDAAGAFSITLVDRPFIGYVDSASLQPGATQVISAESMYGIFEPMDMVEIRMRHSVDGGTTDEPPVVMRGFISSVKRDETVTDTKVVRTVTISGQDYGKLWQMLQILFLPGYVVGQDTISAFKLYERFGVGLTTTQTAAEFIGGMLGFILNPYLANILPEDSPMPKAIVLDSDQLVKHGVTSITGPQNKEGTIYDILRSFGDVGIWNELFLEDREDGVYCVYRPNPYKDASGNKIVFDAADVVVTDLPDTDVIAMSVSRSDANVANYFWVRSARFEMSSDLFRRQNSVQADPDKTTVLLSDYANTSDKLYGIRMMFVDTEMGGDDVTTFNSGLPEGDLLARDTSQAGWIDSRRALLVNQNKDNVIFETGMLRVKGNEKIRAGTYVKLQRGTFEAEYYVPSLIHQFIPFQGFYSTLNVERGTGFIERAKREGGSDSPYFAELVRP